MLVQGALQEGPEIRVRFYAQDDLRQNEDSGELQPESWFDLSFSEDVARTFVGWLQGNRDMDYHRGTIRAHGTADHLVIKDTDARFAVRLGTREEVNSLVRELSGTLALIIGQPVDPSTL